MNEETKYPMTTVARLMPDTSIETLKKWAASLDIGGCRIGRGRTRLLTREDVFKLWMIHSLRADNLPSEYVEAFIQTYSKKGVKEVLSQFGYIRFNVELAKMEAEFAKVWKL